jgi:hypothetical protein
VSNKALVRCLAVLLCLGILAVAVPSLSSATRTSGKMTVAKMLKMPALVILSLLPAQNAYSVSADQIGTKAPGQTPARVRPTTDIPIPRPGTGD